MKAKSIVRSLSLSTFCLFCSIDASSTPLLISKQYSQKIQSDEVSDKVVDQFPQYSKKHGNVLQAAINNNDLDAFFIFLDFEDPKSAEELALAHPEIVYLYFVNEKLGVPNDYKSLKIQKEIYRYTSNTPDQAAIQNYHELGSLTEEEYLSLINDKLLNEKLGFPNDPESLRIHTKIYQYSQKHVPALLYTILINDVEIAPEIMRLYPDQITMLTPTPAHSELFQDSEDLKPFLRGKNALELAVEGNRLQLAHLLLSTGFDPNQEALRYNVSSKTIDENYYTHYNQYRVQGSFINSLTIAKERNYQAMTELLLQYGAILTEPRPFDFFRNGTPWYIHLNW